MNCIKCGREIPEGKMFCQECKLPPVILPEETAASKKVKPPRKSRRKKRKVKKFDFAKAIRRLRTALLVISLLFALLATLVALEVNDYLLRKENLRHREASVSLREKEADNRDRRIDELEQQLEDALKIIGQQEETRGRR